MLRSNAFNSSVLLISISLLLDVITTDAFDNRTFRNISGKSTFVLYVDDFGAQGDGFTDDTKSFKDAWEVACCSSSRVKIVIPVGKFYLVGPTDFVGPCLSKVTLRVSGVIVAPKDPAIWDGLDEHKWLNFSGIKHLKVEGGGVIDGMGMECRADRLQRYVAHPVCFHAGGINNGVVYEILDMWPYKALTFTRCNNLKIRHMTLVNAPKFHLTFSQCTHVAASGITVIAPRHSPNTDGVHISESKHVKLKDITAATGDDCISIVNNSSKIRIRNVFCGPGHGISIGSLGKNYSSASVQDVTVNGAVFVNTDNGVRIKTWQGGRGAARKIKFENIWMNNVSNPIIINQYYCDSPVPCSNQTSAVVIEAITFRGIRGTSATELAIKLACSDNHPCKKIHLENIQLVTSNGTAAKSFCWEASGSTSLRVYPSSCI